ncbi:MAG: hypothetical protein M1823_000246 [Watsoniomyces obsoletus]|nr:MAG: hypothetical protein M1823_000246 [Watsoniomyces obsoletus]
MPAPVPISIPTPRKPLHLLRALLRECTYLPDPAARFIIAHHVVRRFRDYKTPPGIFSRSDQKSQWQQRRRHVLATGRQYWSVLVRANHGELRMLEKVLQFTYGRRGKRRRQLFTELLRVELSSDGNAVRGRQDGLGQSGPKLESWQRRTSKVEALLASHVKEKPPTETRRSVRRLEPVIGLNTWHRKMPKKREINIRRKFHADMLARLHAPLPMEEWSRLRDLVTGTRPWEGVVPRRSRVDSVSEADSSLLTAEFLGQRLGQERYQITPTEHPHRITARVMRRQWAKIFVECPSLWWDTAEQKWQVKWGWSPFGKNTVISTPKGSIQENMFAGVDEHGKVTKSGSAASPPSQSRKRSISRLSDDRPVNEGRRAASLVPERS